jgi:YggT family protein
MTSLLANIINFIANILVAIIFIDSLLSFFVDPYHPARRFLGTIINPMLVPIRRYIPPVGMFDLSPLILMIVIKIMAYILVRVIILL